MKLAASILTGLGLLLVTGLIAYHGMTEVVGLLAAAGWGLALVALFHLLPLVADALGWHVLIPRTTRPSLVFTVWARWLGESINGLLPVAQVGGDVVKARLLMRHGTPAPAAGASVVVDLTVSVLSQLVFTLMGLGFLVAVLGGGPVATTAAWGVAISGLLVGGFFVVQRQGLFARLARLLDRVAGGSQWLNLVGGAKALDIHIAGLYQQRATIGWAFLWRMVGWLVGVGEVWLALHFLGVDISFAEAFLLESLGQAIRAAAFAVPGALGVQEGGYLLLGGLLGLGPEVSLALALSKRVRELALGIPGLLLWQFHRSRRLWRDWSRTQSETQTPVKQGEAGQQ